MSDIQGDAVVLKFLDMVLSDRQVVSVDDVREIARADMKDAFDYVEAFEREARIRALRKVLRHADDAKRIFLANIESKNWKVAAAVANEFSMSLAQTQERILRAFALRASRLAPSLMEATVSANWRDYADLIDDLGRQVADELTHVEAT